MKKLFLIVPVLLFVFSSYSWASTEMGVLGLEGDTGMFCNIEEAEVCVVAQSEDDCKKLEGKKVDACPQSQENE